MPINLTVYLTSQYTHFYTGNKTVAEALQVDESSIAIVCWKGGASLTVMVTSIECQELLERLLMRSDKVREKGSSMLEQEPSNNAEDVEQESNGNSQGVEAA
jgi:multisite-specific tRNA:(cytosine-C5)-methyltransferase